MTNRIERCILHFHRRLTADAHHRFRSWGHCYRYFRLARTSRIKPDLDLAALHLGFYLASWGMYRGASFLLWKDYKLHSYAVRDLFRHEYMPLWDLDYARVSESDGTVDRLLDLTERLRETYGNRVRTVNGTRRRLEPTDALVTKILLGTMACTPAYDEFVRNGLYADHIKYSYLNKQHVLALWQFCRAHDAAFRRAQRCIREGGLRYPIFKLVDMYFWIRGQPAAGTRHQR